MFIDSFDEHQVSTQMTAPKYLVQVPPGPIWSQLNTWLAQVLLIQNVKHLMTTLGRKGTILLAIGELIPFIDFITSITTCGKYKGI